MNCLIFEKSSKLSTKIKIFAIKLFPRYSQSFKNDRTVEISLKNTKPFLPFIL